MSEAAAIPQSEEKRVDDVDQDVRRFTDGINKSYAAIEGLADMSLPQRRAIAEEIRRPWCEGGPQMAETVEMEIAGCRARLHKPAKDTPLPVLFYIHGGGWTLFSIDTHDRLMREYAARANIAVVGIDYSLSPEARFPVALDEVVSALTWLQDKSDQFGIDMSSFAIGGDSAGANLSVAAALRLKEKGDLVPSALLLSYGVFTSQHTDSYKRYSDDRYSLEVDEMDWFWANYVRGPADHENPLVEPLKADLAGMPSVFMAIAECDILADGNRAFAAALEKAGVAVNATTYSGATHSFLEAVSVAPLADQALQEQSDWLRTALTG